MDFEAHLKRQMAWSRATFGPGDRHEGVVDHIEKEINELREAYEEFKKTPSPLNSKLHEHYSQVMAAVTKEWVDLVILSLDGLTRHIHSYSGGLIDDSAVRAVNQIVQKQGVNEMRDWPDWRTAAPNKAIEHNK